MIANGCSRRSPNAKSVIVPDVSSRECESESDGPKPSLG